MLDINVSSAQRVFCYFEQLSAIHRGSGDMEAIARYCVNFAKEHNLKYVHDAANNVIIFKDGTVSYEQSEPIILQGHLDMVCQKTNDCNINFGMFKIIFFPVKDSSGFKQGRPTSSDIFNYFIVTRHIQESVLLTCKGSFRQIFCSS